MAKNKVISNISYLGIVQILNYALPLITIPLVSRALGVDKIGLVTYIMSYTAYFTLLVAYSFGWTAVRKQATCQNINYTFSLVFTSQLYLLAFSSITFLLCVYVIPDLQSNKLLALFTFISVVAVFFDKSWVYQYYEDLSIVAIANVTIKILSVACIILAVNQQSDYLAYAFILSVVQLITNSILFFIAIYKYKISLIKISFSEIFAFLKESKNLFFSSIVISLYTSTSILLLGIFCTNTDVGLYTSASKVVEIAKVFALIPITQIIYPIVSKKIAENRELGVAYVQQLMPIFHLLTVFVLAGMLLCGPFVIKILYGQHFLGAIPIFLVLSFTLVFIIYSTVFGILLMVNLGLDHLFLKNQIFVALLSIFVTVLILPYGQGLTSATILVLSEVMITAYQYWCLKQQGYSLITKDMFSKNALINAFKVLRS